MSLSQRERATVKRARRILKREQEERRARLRRRIRIQSDPAASVGPTRQREPRRRERLYLMWLRRWPCVACMAGLPDGGGVIEAAHPKFGMGLRRREFGVGEKSHDRFAVPLCSKHHRTGSHAEHRGQRAFWARLGIDVADFADALNTAFNADGDGRLVIQEFAQRRQQ